MKGRREGRTGTFASSITYLEPKPEGATLENCRNDGTNIPTIGLICENVILNLHTDKQCAYCKK